MKVGEKQELVVAPDEAGKEEAAAPEEAGKNEVVAARAFRHRGKTSPDVGKKDKGVAQESVRLGKKALSRRPDPSHLKSNAYASVPLCVEEPWLPWMHSPVPRMRRSAADASANGIAYVLPWSASSAEPFKTSPSPLAALPFAPRPMTHPRQRLQPRKTPC